MKFRPKIVIDIIGFLLIFYGLNHASGTNPVDIFDDAYLKGVDTHFDHPPIPALHMVSTRESLDSKKKNSINSLIDDSEVLIGWSSCYLDISAFVDSVLGYISTDDQKSALITYGRTSDIKHPGFYLNAPPLGLKSEFSEAESEEFSKLLNESLGDQLHPLQAADFTFIYKFAKVIGDAERTEFFGKTEKEGIKIAVGGWFDKFASIGVFVDFTDIDSFLKKANIYFNLPLVEKENVVVHKKGDEFLFSVEDRENMYLLRGYDTEGSCWEVPDDPGSKNGHHKVIELIKYIDKEFMP